MNILCGRNKLIEGINIVSKAVSSKTMLPILECILLQADGGEFKMTASDLELGIETSAIEADIISPGTIAVEARVFSDIIRSLPEGTVDINVEENMITTIRCGKSEFQIIGRNGDDFPVLPQVDKNDGVSISGLQLKNMIRQTIFSVSLDETKTAMTGELVEIKDGFIKLVSVDGFRISVRTAEIAENMKDKDIKAIIPGKTLSELSRIIPSDAGQVVSIFFTNKHVLFEMENCVVVSRVIESEFINYENVFTVEYTTKVYINKDAFLDAIERATLISKDVKKNPVKVSINDGEIVITSSTEIGASREEISAELDGAGMDIAFNPKYLIDVLKVIDDPVCALQLTTPLSPCIIRSDDNDTYKYLVLPLRIKG